MGKGTKLKGFIIKKKSLLNKDILFTIFSEELGKVSVIAKGIKKITSRRAPHIQTGNLVNVELSSRGDILYLQDSFLISGFSQIRDSEQKTNFLFLYFFVLDRILPEHQQELKMYTSTQQFLFEMARKTEFTKQSFTEHLNKLLSIAGYVQGEKTLPELIRTVEEVINEKVPVSSL
ncbi:MAG: DNA repair protein RecO [Patescibacteria group bacterium]